METHKNLTWTTDTVSAMKNSDIIFVCVNTYSKPVTTQESSYGVELDMGSL
jgi:UDP-glucose 6-dehydrogenase